MNIEDVIEYHAKQLKEEVGTALNGDECYDLIKDAVYEALESVKPNIVLAPVIERDFQREDLVWVNGVIYEIDSIRDGVAHVTSLKCELCATYLLTELTLVR